MTAPASDIALKPITEAKYRALRELLASYDSCVIAYSGGVDSVFLAKVAHDVLGQRSLAAIADSPSLPRRELQEALEIAERFEIPVRVLQTQEFSDPRYLSNPENRCYFCKHALFRELEPMARSLGYQVLAYGENATTSAIIAPEPRRPVSFKFAPRSKNWA